MKYLTAGVQLGTVQRVYRTLQGGKWPRAQEWHGRLPLVAVSILKAPAALATELEPIYQDYCSMPISVEPGILQIDWTRGSKCSGSLTEIVEPQLGLRRLSMHLDQDGALGELDTECEMQRCCLSAGRF